MVAKMVTHTCTHTKTHTHAHACAHAHTHTHTSFRQWQHMTLSRSRGMEALVGLPTWRLMSRCSLPHMDRLLLFTHITLLPTLACSLEHLFCRTSPCVIPATPEISLDTPLWLTKTSITVRIAGTMLVYALT